MTYTKSIAHFQRWDGKKAIVITDMGEGENARFEIQERNYYQTVIINQLSSEEEFKTAFKQALEHFNKQI